MFRTGIVIVTHNSGNYIASCVEAVNRHRGPSDIVLVIDNASAKPLPPVNLRATDEVRLNDANVGFAAAVNQGFNALQDRVDGILLLNPDVILQTPLDPLAEACQVSGLAGGCLTDPAGRVQTGFAFRSFPTPWSLFFETIGINKLWRLNPVNRRYRCLTADYRQAQTVDQPAGALLMIRKDVWQKLNGFDVHFHPIWFEDVDFCRRAADVGYHAAYVPAVVGLHAGGHSVSQVPDGDKRRYWYASLLRYSRKHFGTSGNSLVAGGVAATSVARAMLAALRWRRSFKETAMNLSIARTALVYPRAKPGGRASQKPELAGAADVRSPVFDEGSPSNQNTERTLKRLHAR